MATKALTETEITERLQQLTNWAREGDTITRTFKLTSYAAGLALASAIGTIADSFDHHPDMLITWRKVRVSFTTHDAGNKLSHKDFDVAQAVDLLKYQAAE